MKWLWVAVAVVVLAGIYYAFGVQKLNLNPTTPLVVVPTSTPSLKVTGGSVSPTTSPQMVLSITSPADGATVSTTTVVIKGVTTPGSDVFINDAEGKANAHGNFTVPVTLDPGENVISVMAVDSEGNTAEKQITLTLN